MADESDVIFREIDLSAEVRRMWGKKWNSPETAYEFSNGRKFELRTGDAGIYAGTAASGDPRILEDDGLRILEDGSIRVRE